MAAILAAASPQLAAALGLEKREARLEARVLAAHVLGVDAAWLIAHDTDPLTDTHIAAFESLLFRRLDGVPIAYLVGTREFYGRPFRVSPDVLIPRPDTELLVEQALARIPSGQAVEVLDLGTGSGCIAITLALERPLARSHGGGSLHGGAGHRAAQCRHPPRPCRVFDQRLVRRVYARVLTGRRFDLIVGNPPYIAAADPHLDHGDVRFEPLDRAGRRP